MISVGLDVTCDAFDKSRSRYVTTLLYHIYVVYIYEPAFYVPVCSCSNAILYVAGTNIKFHHNISTSEVSFNYHPICAVRPVYSSLQVTAWIGTGILTVMTVVHYVVLCLYIRHNRQRQYEYGRLDSDATDQEESKPEAV